MAALLERVPRSHTPELVDLRNISVEQIEPLLGEEVGDWEKLLDWDFRKSADLVRRFVDLRALSGCALVKSDQIAGYAYFVHEEHKGLIGDLYVRKPFRTPENEDLLLGAVLEGLMSAPGVRRIESQLMMLGSDPHRAMPFSRFLNIYDRNFMLADLTKAERLAPGRGHPRVHLEKWSEQHQENAAQLIASAYAGHIDGSINDQYRSLAGARRFLYNIVQYPGCGSFFKPASWMASDRAVGSPCGLVLASQVGAASGHITQICVSPALRGTGLGYELLRQSMASLQEHGCRTVSLTVTAANHEAVRLYDRTGFRTAHRFPAYVWEGF